MRLICARWPETRLQMNDSVALSARCANRQLFAYMLEIRWQRFWLPLSLRLNTSHQYPLILYMVTGVVWADPSSHWEGRRRSPWTDESITWLTFRQSFTLASHNYWQSESRHCMFNLHVFRLWEESGALRGIQCRYWGHFVWFGLTVSPVLSPLHSLVLVLIDVPLRFCSFHLFAVCLSSRSPLPLFSPTSNPNVRPPKPLKPWTPNRLSWHHLVSGKLDPKWCKKEWDSNWQPITAKALKGATTSISLLRSNHKIINLLVLTRQYHTLEHRPLALD